MRGAVTQLPLFNPLGESPAEDLRSPGLAHGGPGPARLLRALIRHGLPQDAWPAAAALVLELEREAPSLLGAARRKATGGATE